MRSSHYWGRHHQIWQLIKLNIFWIKIWWLIGIGGPNHWQFTLIYSIIARLKIWTFFLLVFGETVSFRLKRLRLLIGCSLFWWLQSHTTLIMILGILQIYCLPLILKRLHIFLSSHYILCCLSIALFNLILNFKVLELRMFLCHGNVNL